MSNPPLATTSTSRPVDYPHRAEFHLDDSEINQHQRSSSKLVGSPLLYAITCFASLGVFLFGYDQGVMSGIITGPYFKSYFGNPTATQLGTMVAILEVGAFITSLLAGTIADKIGRKRTLFWGAAVFVIGGGIQSGSTSFMAMVLGRIISGFGVGLLSMIVPIYQSEISPADHRGKLACIEFTGNITGYACSVWLDYFTSFIKSDASWRLPLLFQCIIGGILALGSLIIPESPRWLLDQKQDDEGFRVLVDIHGGYYNNVKADREYREIRDAVEQDSMEPDRSYTCLFKKYKARVFIAMSSQLFAQLNGINVISYYMPLVMISAGWVGRDALLMTGINSLVYIASTIPPWYLVDKLGRRFILLSGATVMCFSLTLTGWWIYIDVPITPTAVVICVIVFNAAFGYSWGPIPWLYPPEIMPLSFRAKGVSLSTASNWAANFLVGELTPILQDVIQWRLYPMHALFCACSFVLVYFLYPETANIPLEEMSDVFGDSDPSPEEVEQLSLRKQTRSLRQSSVNLPSLANFNEYDQRQRQSETNLRQQFSQNIFLNSVNNIKKWINKGKPASRNVEGSDSYERLGQSDI
ncbi:Sugar transporter STL1 [Wallemia ichthyophaga EXF-994]|uniref:Sugar transporter STL1 n=1 Tax=Wallemia ichthyophaga (strain EXF-994 / CBS 113033) TaxID=1299270 RepID=R9AID7_WALI9|nr:Sugar transporter STL1 [Wallemia ichthyophaga EXF-994]EOR01982.1 Sugar transporter STL1 [Wallemia ichthyophaga EXF-994]